jgi:hypothetical protein
VALVEHDLRIPAMSARPLVVSFRFGTVGRTFMGRTPVPAVVAGDAEIARWDQADAVAADDKT